MEFFIKNQWYFLGGLLIFLVVVILIHNQIIKLLQKRDFKKSYSTDRLRKKIRQREDTKTGKLYYGTYFFAWQKNKLNTLCEMFPVGEYFTDKLIVTDVAVYSTVTDKMWGSGTRTAFYKKEFRIYYKVAEKRESIVNNFTHNGAGNQINTVNQNEVHINAIINQLENFLNEVNVDSHDKAYIESFIYRLSQEKATEKDKNKIIETLSKYTSVGNNVISIIANLSKFFI
ncbi:hypothetical protein [Enterococcus casseliflavus]|uniref:hypothetical protein n=1 Tax=Enterococcus sp. AZ154 TaxID=2774683 RepID=UPI001FD5660A|nr:hypothetical protein LLW22_02655 [Enterococcus casseliflavus]